MSQPTAFRVSVDTDWSVAAPRWRDLATAADATPFQRFDWLDAWYRNIAPATGARPRLVTVSDASTGDFVVALPLVSVPGSGGATLRFGDDELTDYNAPLLGAPDVAPGRETALWHAVASALPGHVAADLRKMPRQILGRANPFAALAGAEECSVGSNVIALDGTFVTYHETIDRRVRMELERCWRVLHREANVTFESVRDEATALQVLDVMDRQQRDRLTEMGSPFALDLPAQAALYRHRLCERLASGTVMITTVKVGDEIIAALYAIADGDTAVVLRISNAGKAWSRVSPGRLIVHRSIEWLYEHGFKVCDLSIGDYDYKRRFGVVRTPLVDLVIAMSWRGRLAEVRHRAIGALRARPELDARVRGLVRRLKPRPQLPR